MKRTPVSGNLRRNGMVALIMALGLCLSAAAQSLVLLTTNDTHSNIDIDSDGKGGVLPRKAIIDSVRKAEKNVLLIDAGDMVQGTLYFKFFRGDVEYPLFNMMDYDVRILGNHEFDNGLDELAKNWKNVKGSRLSSNYDFSGTPAEGIFKPYVIKKVDGKKVGFLAINVDPAGLIIESNYKGMKYADPVETANAVATELRRKGCDLVVAVTHVGYDEVETKTDDIDIARRSKDIDIIIGGHSHTFVDPATPDKTPYWIPNAEGRDVLVTQTGKYGRNIGYIKLDLKDFSNRNIAYEYIPVTDRFSPDAYSQEIRDFLAPYRQSVDSVNAHVIGWAAMDMANAEGTGAYANWAGDFAARFGRQVADSLRRAGMDLPPVAFGLMNVGGIRQNLKKGPVSEGHMLSTFPFSNHMKLIELSGKDIADAMAIAARDGGQGVSSEVRVVTDSAGSYERMYINDMEINPDATYLISTLDYVAEGNDDMASMKNHREIWGDEQDISTRVLEYIYDLTSKGLPIEADPSPRFIKDVRLELNTQ